MTTPAEFVRPNVPNLPSPDSKTGVIKFDVTVTALELIPGSNIYGNYRIAISPDTTADQRAICEVILDRTAEPTATCLCSQP
jgi:hypothetical protein